MYHGLHTQVEDSGDRIPKELAAKRRKKRWILQEYTGSHWNMEAVFRSENFRIFSDDFRPVSGGKAQESDRNAPEKSGNFPARILLPCSDDFRCIPAGAVPYSLTLALLTAVFRLVVSARYLYHSPIIRNRGIHYSGYCRLWIPRFTH